MSLILVGTLSPTTPVGAQANYRLLIPVVTKQYPHSQFLGVQVNATSNPTVNSWAEQSGSYWYRASALRWDLIEANPGERNWSAVDEQGLANATAHGQHIIATIFGSPSWARDDPHVCAAIKQASFPQFAAFLTDLVSRYSLPPYSIHVWELGNEPDVDPSLVATDSVFGCWGNMADTSFYGGGYYAQMLNVAYPAIKAADPTAQVMIGGLLHDCDPTHPPVGKNCLSSKFFEGILANGNGSNFDWVSFHGYPQYAPNTNPIWSETSFITWSQRGGVVMGKVNFLRETMAKYGLNKPIYHTEVALTCNEKESFCANPGPDFEQAKASYLVWMYTRNLAEGISGTTWFTLDGPGWRHSGLLDDQQQPLPAYNAMEFLYRTMNNATLIEKITSYPSLIGYAFSVAGKRVEVVASPDNGSHSLTLPSGKKAINIYGNQLSVGPGTIQVQNTIYIIPVP